MRPRGFRILSANLANGRADVDGFAALVEATDPDVVTVQELVPEHADALARLLPFGKLEPARDHNGMGIALKAAGSVRLFELPYRSAYVAELPWSEDGEPIEVLNVHLAAPHVHPVVQRICDRRGQVRAIVDHLDATPRRRRVLVGDLNATPLWPAYRRLRDPARRRGGARRPTQGRRPGRTWGPWSGSMRLLRIDHVLVQGLVATETRVLPLRGSDHSALVADLTPGEHDRSS